MEPLDSKDNLSGMGTPENKPFEQIKNSALDNSSKRDFSFPYNNSVCLDVKIRDRFRVLLNRIGRSQNWLADEVGISRGTMSKIVNGGWFPATQVMVRICEILEIDSVCLFGDSEYWKNWNNKIIYPKEIKK
ncbi:helix-turn-helix domain-containing protein [Candidatus Pacearchaeota archaeon]|nr:helix-turn-helix domain-containing protein [Candidatus Pacearchaeota archaeon]